jgi:hypothetical protein
MLPVKQPSSVGVMDSIAVLPRVRTRVAGESPIVKPGDAGAAMARAMVVVALRVPEVPVIVIVDVPATAEQLDVSVSTLLPEVGLVANAAVMPVGSPDAARVTLPENPPTSTTVIVSDPLPP